MQITSKRKIDLKAVVCLAEDIINVLKKARTNYDNEFHKLFILARPCILIYLYIK